MSVNSVLVTGGAGFIGSNFVDFLIERNLYPVVLDVLTYAGHRENLPPPSLKKYELIVGNICDQTLVGKILREHQISAVFHLAAESHVDRSIEGPAPFLETNVVGTFSMLSACHQYWQELPEEKRKSFRFVHVSTDEVFGSLEKDDPKFSHDSPVAPNSPYSASKASGDLFARSWFHTFQFPVMTTHCSNNYGPKQYPEKLIPFMIHCALEGRPLGVYGDGKNVRDWIHVNDHCEGIFLTFQKGTLGEHYLFGGNEERENIWIVRQICKLLDQKLPKKKGSYLDQIQFVKDRPGHDRRYAIDNGHAQKELGFQPKVRFEEGLNETVDWYLSHQDWRKNVLEKNQ